ncbi:hypothetical protein L3Q82_025121 [Scortum barcoo]|uniref:Uncharacterized protein n=1 Tax=Scortum barcoo TaxID=214431 RepID=A0ACB8WRJ5_9TELE|nr:hypothetical protein L3Q82_025121 [Scortum barcoo]
MRAWCILFLWAWSILFFGQGNPKTGLSSPELLHTLTGLSSPELLHSLTGYLNSQYPTACDHAMMHHLKEGHTLCPRGTGNSDGETGACPGTTLLDQGLLFLNLHKRPGLAWIKTGRQCWKCRRDHQAAQYYFKAKCQQCNQTHLEILHDVNSTSSVKPEMPAPATYYLDPSWISSCVLLKMIKVFLYNGKWRIETYAILDDGSERTILLHSAAQQLGLQGQCEELALRTIQQDTRTVQGRTVSFSVSSTNLPQKPQPLQTLAPC